MHFNETGCANPWSASINDSGYQKEVRNYLEQQNIEVKKISISNDGPISGCFSCFCSTGRRINIILCEVDKKHALDIGFYEN
jgi:multimeric flavodoxin WrbA